MSHVPPPMLELRILTLLPPGVGSAALEQAQPSCHPCGGLEEFCREMRRGAGAGLVALRCLLPEAMPCLMDILDHQETWSDFPLLILFEEAEWSPSAGLRMLDLLKPLGNVTILHPPLNAVGLASAIRAALRSRRRQYQVRDLLRQRERSLRQRDRFLSLLAHELRNPLGAIRNAAHILERLGPSTGFVAEQKDLIERQTTRLAQLIAEMLDVYQMETGKIRLRREPTDLADVAGRCLTEAATREPRHQLVFTRGSAPVYVDGDRERLGQVIGCLLANAVRRTPPGGRVALNVAREEGQAVVRVTDSGPTLSSQEIAHFFDPFSESEDPPEGMPEGGLPSGMTRVQALVQLHGGSVAADGGPGIGCLVVLRLPLTQAHDTASPEPVPAGRGPRRVLVVEDNPDGRESLRLLLHLWGHQVETAENGAQGVQKAQSWQPELALIDIGLPDQDGYRVARQVRAALGTGVYLAAMTGYGQPHDRETALEAGFNTFLVKPVAPAALEEVLASPKSGPGTLIATGSGG